MAAAELLLAQGSHLHSGIPKPKPALQLNQARELLFGADAGINKCLQKTERRQLCPLLSGGRGGGGGWGGVVVDTCTTQKQENYGDN